MRKVLFTFLLSFLISMPVSAQQVFDGIAAIVGNDVVLISDINALVTQYAFQNKVDMSRQPELYNKLGEKFLNTLIDQKLLLIKADEDTIQADENRVDQTLNQQIDYMINQAGSVEKLEEYYSASLYKVKQDLRKEIVNQMKIGMLREKRFSSINVSRKEVENFYKTHKDSLPNRKTSVNISHILMRVTPSKKSAKEAYQKISEIKEKLDAGEKFAELARNYSEDPGTAKNGGDLGFVTRGTLVKEFEETAFNLEEGEISDIVQTQFGFHIIQLLERQGERIHVRHILVRLQPSEKDEQRVIEELNQIRQKIINGDSTFEQIALAYSDDPNVQQDSGNLGEFEEGGFQIEEFANTVKKLEEGEISKPFRTKFGYHILKLNKRDQARKLSLEDDWQQIEQWALQNKREKEFKEWIAELRQEIPIEIKIDI